jgi:hypothetical protein
MLLAMPCYRDDAADKLKQGEEPIYSYQLDIRALVEEQLLKWPGTSMEEMKPDSHKLTRALSARVGYSRWEARFASLPSAELEGQSYSPLEFE